MDSTHLLISIIQVLRWNNIDGAFERSKAYAEMEVP